MIVFALSANIIKIMETNDNHLEYKGKQRIDHLMMK